MGNISQMKAAIYGRRFLVGAVYRVGMLTAMASRLDSRYERLTQRSGLRQSEVIVGAKLC